MELVQTGKFAGPTYGALARKDPFSDMALEKFVAFF